MAGCSPSGQRRRGVGGQCIARAVALAGMRLGPSVCLRSKYCALHATLRTRACFRGRSAPGFVSYTCVSGDSCDAHARMHAARSSLSLNHVLDPHVHHTMLAVAPPPAVCRVLPCSPASESLSPPAHAHTHMHPEGALALIPLASSAVPLSDLDASPPNLACSFSERLRQGAPRESILHAVPSGCGGGEGGEAGALLSRRPLLTRPRPAVLIASASLDGGRGGSGGGGGRYAGAAKVGGVGVGVLWSQLAHAVSLMWVWLV
jgi:hypothetical protein